MNCDEKMFIDELGVDTDIMTCYPSNPSEIKFINYLSKKAIEIALTRHVGSIKHEYSGSGRIAYSEGKDLTKIKYIVGTGGVLSKLVNGNSFLKDIFNNKKPEKLLPVMEKVIYYKDKDYIMSSLGALSEIYPRQAIKLLRKSLELE